MEKVTLFITLIFLLCPTLVNAILITPLEKPIIYPGEYHKQQVIVRNEENVERDVLLYLGVSSPEVICFFEKNTTAMVLTLQPNEERIVNITMYVFRGAKSGNYSCMLYHLTAITPVAEAEFKNLSISVPYLPYEKEVVEAEESVKILRERERLLLLLNGLFLSLTILFLILWLRSRSSK